jgi:AraC-like DNA-binding protein
MIPEFYFRLLDYENKTLDHVWGSRWHCDAFWRMYVNDKAGGYLELEDDRYSITPNQAHFVPAWVRIRCGNPKILRHFFVHFEMVGISSSILRRAFPRPICSGRSLRYDQIVRSSQCDDVGKLRKDLPGYCHIKSILYREFHRVFTTLPPEQARWIERFAARSHDFAPVMEYIEEHLDEPLGNERLAEIGCMSKSHFIRRFHNEVGQSPAEYVRERRIAAAAIQLIFTDDSIERISERQGFPNRFYFSRVFTSLIGVPPATYRRRGIV